MVLPPHVRFSYAPGDYQSFDTGCRADSIALGPAALRLPDQLYPHISWILVQAGYLSPAFCHYRRARGDFVISRY